MRHRKIIGAMLILLCIGLLVDLYAPVKYDFKQFDPVKVGTLDAAMWRSYYERKPLKLFVQLSSLMRTQFHAPWVWSFVLAYHSARAAFIFKDGQNRTEYAKALPALTAFYYKLNALAKDTFDVKKMAALELEWWIIRREVLTHTSEDWKIILGLSGETMYHIPANRFGTYADQRVRAMVLRDGKGQRIMDEDWMVIKSLCIEAWTSLYKALHTTP